MSNQFVEFTHNWMPTKLTPHFGDFTTSGLMWVSLKMFALPLVIELYRKLGEKMKLIFLSQMWRNKYINLLICSRAIITESDGYGRLCLSLNYIPFVMVELDHIGVDLWFCHDPSLIGTKTLFWKTGRIMNLWFW